MVHAQKQLMKKKLQLAIQNHGGRAKRKALVVWRVSTLS